VREDTWQNDGRLLTSLASLLVNSAIYTVDWLQPTELAPWPMWPSQARSLKGRALAAIT